MLMHLPVLLSGTIEGLRVVKGGTYVDCTLGGGGHSRAILDRLGPGGRLVGIDQDPRALEAAKPKLEGTEARVDLVQGNFRHLGRILAELGIDRVHGILLDLGVSSFQLDEKERGFSYWEDAELDMRMSPAAEVSAYDLVNKASEPEMVRIIRDYGEERWASRIAKFIVERRRQQAITSTQELVEIIKAAIPAAARRTGPHPARRTFQAIRIAVNDELGALADVLDAALDHLVVGGRMAVISFHSLEDRLVKERFARAANPCTCPTDLPVCVCNAKPQVKLITRKPIVPGEDEIAQNPRSRSSRLRVVEKI
ncbi:MAG: 16S rRNA (cytosine(1402)-N(4))-methyltransferase RsmH [Firmicutes bacterium]|nr:16S rRNA (cytosine(1402)-N(4))-methyltransferase RsmH [Bacillota bacterium]